MEKTPDEVMEFLKDYTGPAIARSIAAYHAFITGQVPPVLPWDQKNQESRAKAQDGGGQ